MKLDTGKGGAFRVASGDVIPNLRATKLVGTGTLNSSPMQMTTQEVVLERDGGSFTFEIDVKTEPQEEDSRPSAMGMRQCR